MKTYYVKVETSEGIKEWSKTCSGPVQALNAFHERAQEKEGMAHDKYKFAIMWCDGVTYDDLLKSKNPDLAKAVKKPAPSVTPEFAGMPKSGEGALAN